MKPEDVFRWFSFGRELSVNPATGETIDEHGAPLRPTTPPPGVTDIIAANIEDARIRLQAARARIAAEELAPIIADAVKLCGGAS